MSEPDKSKDGALRNSRERRAARRAGRASGLSCRRCQQRKILCNRELPRCQNCAKLNIDCQDGESLKSRSLPRAYVNSLYNRIQWLESLIRARCPDIDLERDGPVVVALPQTAAGIGSEYEGEDALAPVDPDRRLRGGTAASGNVETPANTQDINRGKRVDASAIDDTTTIIDPSTIPSNVGLPHEVGLVSLGANRDPRYIGPSSGYVLSKLMLAASGRAGKITRTVDSSVISVAPFLGELVVETQGPISITKDQASKLCQTYFDIIHVQYPFLHRPTFYRSLQKFFDEDCQDQIVGFQTYMVLAISATIVSRLHKIPLAGERYYTAAMQYFEKIQVESSIQGLQCIILLLIFAMHSPTIKLDVWCLNYQCVASALDLGLQRIFTTRSGISRLDQEMRTRIFWVVYTFDRTIATMMGRPIGLREEACDLRMPADMSDECIEGEADPTSSLGTPTHMSYAILLFELAKVNSEIKYIANSVNREVPKYAFPGVVDIAAWKEDVLRHLDRLVARIPAGRGSNDYIRSILLLRYHSVKMLLLRPSPNLPRPDQDSLRKCYSSAVESIQLSNELYKSNLLVHNWITFYNIVLSTITMFYCILSVPGIATTLEVDEFASNVRASLSVLSAVGEHWSGAKRSRDILDELAGPISRWLTKKRHPENATANGQTTLAQGSASQEPFPSTAVQPSITFDNFDWMPSWTPFDGNFNGQSLSEQYGSTDCANLDNIVISLFDDFNPIPGPAFFT
ncbi:hypothetical protein GGS20DRAFT_595850 [Poronia punctata]|nr:hypothetical protein GGS20DRAFT_595850 [Poronia punctata]